MPCLQVHTTLTLAFFKIFILLHSFPQPSRALLFGLGSQWEHHRRDAELAGESGATAKPDPVPETEPLKEGIVRAAEAKRKDETLQQAWRWGNGDGPRKENVTFFIREGLLHRRWRPEGSDIGDCRTTEQLVLPESMRQDVMRLAHEIHLAGHMEKQKTTARILKRFYWPRIFSDVAEYVRHCAAYAREPRG